MNELSRHLSDKSRNLEIEINETFDRLLRLVEDRRSGILADLQQREAAKQDTLGEASSLIASIESALFYQCTGFVVTT